MHSVEINQFVQEKSEMISPIYVIGHVNPDTDSVAAAISYSWLLKERDNLYAIPARAGAINQQTSWLLRQLGLEVPLLLTDASPRFESVSRRLDTTTPDKPLREAWAIASRTGGLAPILNEDGTPYGLVTGWTLFEFISRSVGTHPKQQEMRISEILHAPCNQAADIKVPKFQASTRIRDVVNHLLRSEKGEYWVVDENNRYLGICRQRDLVNPPRLKLILVDHNEDQQALGSLEEAELLEIIDHHKLGNPATRTAIRFMVDVVGSTCTLISERIYDAGLSAPPQIATVMLAGILADTLILRSPTTTERDREAARRLSRWAFVPGNPMSNETIESFGEKLLAAGAGLGTKSAEDVVNSDMKTYNAGDLKFSISQVEVSDHREITDHIEPLRDALKSLRKNHNLDFSMLMITDVVQGSSRVLVENPPAILYDLPYPPLSDGTLLAEGVVSRKKQLVPTVLSLVES